MSLLFEQNRSRTLLSALYALGFAKKSLLMLNHLGFNNKKAYYDIDKKSTKFIDTEVQLLCFNEPPDELDGEKLRTCLPSSLFLACFCLGHYDEMGGHMGATKTYANAKRFFYWPGVFDSICALRADCIT